MLLIHTHMDWQNDSAVAGPWAGPCPWLRRHGCVFHSLSGAMGTGVCRKHNVQPGNGGTEPRTQCKPLRHESAWTCLHSWLGRSARWQSNGWFKGKGRSWPRSGGIKRMRGPVGKRHLRSWELGQLPCVCSCLFYLFMSFSMMLFTICM